MKKFIAVLAASVPTLASAQVINDAGTLVQKLTGLGNTFIQILIAFAVIFIIYNVVRYLIVGSGDEGKRTAASGNILWGIVGLFVILSIWGLVKILTNTFKTDNTTPTGSFPTVQVPNP